jgi:hypothetical protein
MLVLILGYIKDICFWVGALREMDYVRSEVGCTVYTPPVDNEIELRAPAERVAEKEMGEAHFLWSEGETSPLK